jgi:hypothetical protein
MRKEKALINLLRGLVELLAEESVSNPEFAAKVDRLLTGLPEKKAIPKKSAATQRTSEPLPDIHEEWNMRGETDFRLWLSEQPILMLRAIIRYHGLDPPRRTVKWKEAEKLSAFITDGLRARMAKGAAFIGRESTD